MCLIVCLVVWLCSSYIAVWPRDLRTSNLVPRAFYLRKWEGSEKALASAGWFFFLIGWLKCNN